MTAGEAVVRDPLRLARHRGSVLDQGLGALRA